jgi:uridine kinase
MIGDKIVIKEDFRKVAKEIVILLLDEIRQNNGRYTIAIGGESGSGKTVLSHAISDRLSKYNINTLIISQDDYFHLPPKTNDLVRRKDPSWLGPHKEIQMDLLDQNLKDAIQNKNEIEKPLVDYEANKIGNEEVDLTGIRVIIAEGTYTCLLRNIRTRIFITRTYKDTLQDRLQRNRGSEAGDSFVEGVLGMEHMIIAGHKYLADILITTDFKVIRT